jgi:hypothetical protein
MNSKKAEEAKKAEEQREKKRKVDEEFNQRSNKLREHLGVLEFMRRKRSKK